MKIKVLDGEKIFGNHISDKGLVSNYIKSIKNSQNSTVNNPNDIISQWAKT